MKESIIVNEEELKQDLVDSFGLAQLNAEDQKVLLEKMMEAVVKTIFLQTFERLGEAGVAEYEKLLSRATQHEEIAQFLESRIPGYNVFVKEIVADFKHTMESALQE